MGAFLCCFPNLVLSFRNLSGVVIKLPPGFSSLSNNIHDNIPGQTAEKDICDEAGDYGVSNVLSSRDLVFRSVSYSALFDACFRKCMILITSREVHDSYHFPTNYVYHMQRYIIENPNICAHVLLILSNERWKMIRCEAQSSTIIVFHHKLNKFDNIRAQMKDSIYMKHIN